MTDDGTVVENGAVYSIPNCQIKECVDGVLEPTSHVFGKLNYFMKFFRNCQIFGCLKKIDSFVL